MNSVVVEVNGQKACLLTEDGQFVNAQNKNYLLGQYISFIPLKTAAVYLLSILFVSALFAGIYASFTLPVSHVTMDINPCFSFDLNVYDRVIKILPLNRDAEILSNSADISAHKIESCIAQIVNYSKKLGYLNEYNTNVAIDVVSINKNLYKKLGARVPKLCPADISFDIRFDSNEDYKAAKKLNISLGKLRAIKDYTAKNGGRVEENARFLSGKKLYEIKNYRKEIGDDFIKSDDTTTVKPSTPKSENSEPANISSGVENKKSVAAPAGIPKSTVSHQTKKSENRTITKPKESASQQAKKSEEPAISPQTGNSANGNANSSAQGNSKAQPEADTASAPTSSENIPPTPPAQAPANGNVPAASNSPSSAPTDSKDNAPDKKADPVTGAEPPSSPQTNNTGSSSPDSDSAANISG
ncbi:MAG: hypothetical protein Q8873_05895 [Bacillota bacterium]|nr:hypothetical protein [Bacillota bacterium]